MNFMHIGIDDAVLIGIKASNKLPNEIAHSIDKALSELRQVETISLASNSKSTRNAILEKLVKLGLSYTPKNFQEYVWCVRFAIGMLLLRHCPNSILNSRIALCSHVFATPVGLWDADVEKIHIVAKEIYSLSSDASNIVHIATNISNYCNFTFFVGLSLLWAAFHGIVGQKSNVFRMYELHELTVVAAEMNKIDDRNAELTNIHNFLSLYSVYQSLVLLRSTDFSEYKCFEKCFYVDKNVLIAIDGFLQGTKKKLQSWICQEFAMNKCILMVELLEYDILDALESLIAGHSN